MILTILGVFVGIYLLLSVAVWLLADRIVQSGH